MKKILIDTDCGIDDAVAIMLALASPEVDILGITTLAGNVSLPLVNNNVLNLLAYFNREEIPVYAGASGALLEKPLRAEGIHGKNGLGDVELPKGKNQLQPYNAPQGIYNLAKENPGITLITLGPLTNLALALNLYPDLPELVSNVVVMGGAIEKGNVTQYAEFNFAADPEAVHLVLNSPLPLAIVPWDTCLSLFVTEEEIPWEEYRNSRGGRLFQDLQQVPFAYVERVYGKRAAALPDPAAMAYVIKPDLAKKTITGNLKMELSHTVMRGASVPAEGFRLTLVQELDRAGFINLLSRINSL